MTLRVIDIILAQMKNFMDSGRFSEAIPVGRHLLTMIASSEHIKRGNIYYNLGVCYNELGRYHEAEESYAISCREYPGDSDTWYNRANNHHHWGTQLLLAGNGDSARSHFHSALDYLRRAKQINPSDPDIDRLIASVQNSMQRI